MNNKRKLSLNKETIAKLNESEMSGLKGGGITSGKGCDIHTIGHDEYYYRTFRKAGKVYMTNVKFACLSQSRERWCYGTA